MKEYIFAIGISILFLVVVSQWNFVTAVNSVLKKPANTTAYTENSQSKTPLTFSPDTSNYLKWKLSGR
jgi:hypothetical protein